MNEIEEIKPGFFIRKTKAGYSRVYPVAKDPINKPIRIFQKETWKNFTSDNIRWGNLLYGGKAGNLLIPLALLILLLVYSHDIRGLTEVYESPCSYCAQYQVLTGNQKGACRIEDERRGLCVRDSSINLSIEKYKEMAVIINRTIGESYNNTFSEVVK